MADHDIVPDKREGLEAEHEKGPQRPNSLHAMETQQLVAREILKVLGIE